MPLDNDIEAPPSTVYADFGAVVENALRRGLSVHPLKPRGKEPWLGSWPKQASRDPERISEWKKQFPTSNYGVVATKNICILESDNYEVLMGLLSRPMPPTYVVEARRNRPHIYFRQTEASTKAGNLDSYGIFEFKQHDRYVVGEGSIHPSGSVYQAVQETEIALIPDWLVQDLLRLKNQGPRPSRPDFSLSGRHQAIGRWCGQNWKGPGHEEELIAGAIKFDQEHHVEPRGEEHAREYAEWFIKKNKAPAPKSGSGIVTLDPPKEDKSSGSGRAYDFVLGPLPGARHGIFALGSLHLIQGSSGNGKSTLALQILRAQQERQECLGRPTYGRPYLIVWQDRSEAELTRQLDSLGLLENPPPYVVIDGTQPPAKALEEIYLAQPVKPEIMLVEGLDMWADDAQDMKHVATLATAVRSVGEHYHIALIGTVGMPKMKPKERYTAPRDRAFGSAAWARKADTIMDITVDQETQVRNVQILPRTGQAQHLEFEFKSASDSTLYLRPERVLPKIEVGEEKKITYEKLHQVMGWGRTKIADFLREHGQDGAKELLRAAEVAKNG